jgi:hypothetical protein
MISETDLELHHFNSTQKVVLKNGNILYGDFIAKDDDDTAGTSWQFVINRNFEKFKQTADKSLCTIILHKILIRLSRKRSNRCHRTESHVATSPKAW